jgi:hypothetical protein
LFSLCIAWSSLRPGWRSLLLQHRQAADTRFGGAVCSKICEVSVGTDGSDHFRR